MATATPASPRGSGVATPQPHHHRTAAERVETMAQLMRECAPMELQFLQTLLDNAPQRPDPDTLRIPAKLANNPKWIASLTPSFGRVRASHGVAEYITLLDGDNALAAVAMADVLLDVPWHCTVDQADRFCLICETACHMALIHPAFDMSLREQLHERVLLLLEQRAPVPGEEPTEQELLASPDPDQAVVSAQVVRTEKSLHRKDYVFVIDVTWTNGKILPCHRTYDDFFNFQCKLLDSFPDDARMRPRPIPYLPGKKLIASTFKRNRAGVAGSRLPAIQSYVETIVGAPLHLSRCESTLDFFKACPVCLGFAAECADGCVAMEQASDDETPGSPSNRPVISGGAGGVEGTPPRSAHLPPSMGGQFAAPMQPVYPAYGHPQQLVMPGIMIPMGAGPYPLRALPGAGVPQSGMMPAYASQQPVPIMAADPQLGQQHGQQHGQQQPPQPIPIQLQRQQQQQAAMSPKASAYTPPSTMRSYSPTPSMSSIDSATSHDILPSQAAKRMPHRRSTQSLPDLQRDAVSGIRNRQTSISSVASCGSTDSLREDGGKRTVGKCLLCKSEGHDCITCTEDELVISREELLAHLRSRNVHVDDDASEARLICLARQLHWLKSLRLHKYAPLVVGHSISDLSKYDDESLKAKSVTTGAIKKLLSHFKTLPPWWANDAMEASSV
eukprot:m.332042 g.332042  ORF g.332042 m.332042 type:complete len:672 (+) comp19775_c3_seq1:4835-6850(+)